MQVLTKKHPTEKMVEIRFRGSISSINRLRRVAKELKVTDLLEEKESYPLEELSPELQWNSSGVALRGARGKEGLTQKKLAELVGIAQHHISEMENGKRPIGKETARKLAEALNISDYRVFL
jgi:DNA-binding XRE family transcriptional regulator